MSTIHFICPYGHPLVVPQHRAGKKGRCPVCHLKVAVPVPNPMSQEEEQDEAHEAHAIEYAELDPDSAAELGFHASPAPSKQISSQSPLAPTSAAMIGVPGAKLPPPPTAPPPTSVPPPPAAPAMQPAPGWQPPGPEYVAAPATVRVKSDEKKEANLPWSVRASKGKMQTVYLLAVFLATVVLISGLPAYAHLNIMTAPGWARAVMLLATLQIIYVLWMVALPDWSTVWVGMWLFALVAAAYAMTFMIVKFTAPHKPLMLSLQEVRQYAAGWSAMMVLLMSLMSYICGRVSMAWRRAFEMAKAKRKKLAAA